MVSKRAILVDTQVKVNCEVNIEIKNPPPKIPQEYTESATKSARTFAVSQIINGLLVLLIMGNNEWYITLFVAWLIVGVALGIISGKKYTQNQLRQLVKEVEIYPNKKDRIFAIVPFLIILSCGLLVSWFLFDASIHSSLIGLMGSIFGGVVSLQLTRYALFRSFEKKQNMRIMTRIGGGIVVIPKPPNYNVNRLEMTAEQRH